MKLSQLATVENPQSILVFGPPKSGKTYLVSKLVEAGYNLIWFDTQHGYQTLKLSVKPEHYDKIELIRIPDTSIEPVAIATLVKFFRARGPIRICEAHGIVACTKCKPIDPAVTVDPSKLDSNTVVVIDSFSQVSDSAMAYALGQIQALDYKKKEYDHYDKQGLLLKDILTLQQQARFHRVFITHEETIEQEDGGEKLVPRGGTRNFSRNLARYFDHVVYTHLKNRNHSQASSTTYNTKILTGSRSGVALEDRKADLATLLQFSAEYTAPDPVRESDPDSVKLQNLEVVNSADAPVKPSNPLLEKLQKR